MAYESANPAAPVPFDAIDAVLAKLSAGTGDVAFAAFVRLLNARSVDDL